MFEMEPTLPQQNFLRLTDKFPLFVAGFGSGKSTTECISIFNDLSIPHYEVMKIGAYAPTYDLLKLITIPYLCEMLEQMNIGFKLNRSDYVLTLENDDQIILRSLDNPGRIVGYQTFRAHIDEIDTLKEAKATEAWNKVIARNRQKIALLDDDFNYVYHDEDLYDEFGKIVARKGDKVCQMNRVSAYTTPEGFGFAYKRWEKEPAKGYAKIQAATYSNPHLPPDYIDSLRASYPAGLIDAYIEGEFVNLIGKNVYPGFRRDTHNTDRVAQNNEPIYVGMDFNVVKGASAIHVEDYDSQGRVICSAVDEIHNAYDTDEQITYLKQNYPHHPVNVYPDASGNKRTSANTTETDLAKLQMAGFSVHHNHSNPAIKDRVMSYNAMIKNGKGEIFYYVNVANCPNLTNSLEQQIWGENGLPDKSANLDHIVDGAGYYVDYKHGIVKPSASTSSSHARY